MADNYTNPTPPEVRYRRARRLRIFAVVVMFLGLVGVVAVYWIASKTASESDTAIDYYKRDELQLQRMYGTQGALIAKLHTALRQPGTQAIIFIVATALISGICLFLAKLQDHDKAN